MLNMGSRGRSNTLELFDGFDLSLLWIDLVLELSLIEDPMGVLGTPKETRGRINFFVKEGFVLPLSSLKKSRY
jgi:hypothetical protein